MSKVQKVKIVNKEDALGFFGFLTWVGAAVYFIGQVDGFWNIVVAFIKACVWPAFFIHRVLTLLQV